ncbi:glycoside hydrolase family 32 protein [Paenibacillus sabinae]|uniref:Sucrose-6-phosphate hydrolase n=1 Tax=Paenibacillus sabinae T27 TaxID=1268072 RepID=X4ZEG3_9BACL|nr:glycoside hydrolase family 32 protein [Paenibacillus sabinae]AHV95827.1 sucrose-6-phosphate hydrolase [Paenibacillus sabinae T27]
MSNTLQNETVPITNNRYRLQYHLMPPVGWMNDPNGLIYYKGEYHAFYQHYPYGPYQGPMHWGHAKSKDLVHWEHLPIALTPSMPYDSGENTVYGCWSGSGVDDGGVLTLIYTGHVESNNPVEVQCIARSTDGIHFEKGPVSVIDGPPDAECFGFRDPKVWKRGDKWHLVVGYGKDGKGKALHYTSADLDEWAYEGIAAESDGTMGDMWECPDLFPLGEAADSHVLIFSPMNIAPVKTLYLSGQFDYDTGKFSNQHKDRVDYGFDFYAPQTFEDASGRRIMFGWMNIWGAEMPEKEDGWMGAFTLPRVLTLAEDGSLLANPAEELKALRGSHVDAANVLLKDSEDFIPGGAAGSALEIEAVFAADSSSDAEFGLRVRCSEDGSQYTEISYKASEGVLRMNRDHAGAGEGGVSEATLAQAEDGRIKLRVFLDSSSVELFANDGRRTITNRIYPLESSLGLKLFSRGGDTLLETLNIWQLEPGQTAGAGE